ncbi:cysteine/serine-rich nuclear protein 1-like isoform X2 [Dunckerocampus dactyliophorus]|uniref:cysteine/serine-rich nuclear protein 1-like isoform X2 n=1 Tax=Dunckerocampus dactyliophorus TaxID=161453 RepID=UPI0024049596|nr:cysteine/serine-rich nuclear protein 1-like isoform X2 [Dunckerocampus dactyliophorus]
MAGVLKRKFAEVEDNDSSSSLSSSSPTSSEWESGGEGSSSDTQDFAPHSPPAPTSLPTGSIVKKPKLVKRQCHVRFDQVMVFSFPRCQGFTSVPSRGGATLGMMRRHSALRRYTVAEHELERRCRQRHLLRLRQEGFDALKHKITNEEGQLLNEDVHISDAELEDGGSLQPHSSRQRQALLLAAGVKRIDREEKKQLHALRLSREACGCDCQGFCEPETCACSLAGIKCQVDRFNFPCGCTKDSCGNTEGHVEFDSKRVHTHYIHTVMRLELERRLQDEAMSREDPPGLSEDHVGSEKPSEARAVTSEPYDRCPFGFTLEEEDDVALTIPTSPSFILLPERSVVEENSCSSDTTESSFSSSDCDGGRLRASHEGAPCTLSICDSENNNYSMCDQLRLMAAPLTPDRSNSTSTTPDSAGPHPANTFTDNQSTTATDYQDENANQARDPFEDEDSLEGFPNTPSPTLDYPSSRYMDPSLSSDSDLEFFDSDYPPGPLHSSFKEHRHSDSFHHLQLISSVYLPPCESSAYLLESLIGLTEPSAEQPFDNQLL